jgi:hypothetical protein
VRGHVHVHTALLIQHAARMRHIVTSFVASWSPHFSTFAHKRCDFWKKKLLNTKCVFSFSVQLSFKTSHSKKNLARYCQKCLHVKYPLFLSDVNEI